MSCADNGADAMIDVLLIEDDLIDEMAVLRTVARAGLPYRMHVVRSLAEARRALGQCRYDVILADYQLPDGSSFDLMDVFADGLVIFVTGAWDAAAAAQALRLGVHDYLIKDSQGNYLQLLHYRVETALRQRRIARQLKDSEARLQAILDHAPAAIAVHDHAGLLLLGNRQHACTSPAAPSDSCASGQEFEEVRTHDDGSEHTYLTVSFPMADAGCGLPAIGTISVDITARKLAEQQIRNLAFYDPLTNLPNRRMLLDRLQQALTTSARHGNHGALFFIDLDHFKALNDSLGHDHGDLLLKEVARRLILCVRGEDTVARIGGDEFVVMTVGLDSTAHLAASQAAAVGEKILTAIGQPALLGEHTHVVTPSVGVSLFCGREATVEGVIKRADVAMYQAKAAGRGTVRFFDPLMQASIDTRQSLKRDLHTAVESGELRLLFQCQVDAELGAVGAEALLRWQHPKHGLLLPEQFLPLAEQSGLIVPIGQWVVANACVQLGRWQRQQLSPTLRLALNVSARQFRHESFVSDLCQAVQTHGVDPSLLSLELREGLVQDVWVHSGPWVSDSYWMTSASVTRRFRC